MRPDVHRGNEENSDSNDESGVGSKTPKASKKKKKSILGAAGYLEASLFGCISSSSDEDDGDGDNAGDQKAPL